MASCGSRDHISQLAEKSLRESLDCPEELTILAETDPDSAFGTNYFSQSETRGMMRTMKAVGDSIMKRTHNFSEFDPTDTYVISLAQRQMSATSEIRSMLLRAGKKGDFSGWKVKIDYQSRDHNGTTYRAERWLFLDKEGRNVLRTFEIPLP